MSLDATLRDAYLAANGFGPDLPTAVHPSDEMYCFLAGRARPHAALVDYFRSGHEALLGFEHVFGSLGRPLDGLGNVLDFACGFGRLTRFLAHRLGPAKIWAAEIDPRGIEFVTSEFGVHGLVSDSDPATVELPDGFDAIWVGSLFSHLPRARFGPWLRRLYEALAPEGTLIFSTLGEHSHPNLPVDPSGFTYVHRNETVENRLDVAEYGVTYVRPAVVEAIADAEGVTQLVVLERDLWSVQDVYVARRTSAPALDALRSTPTMYGRIHEVRFPAPRHVWLAGSARTVARETPVDEVRICIDGADVTAARLGEPRELRPATPHHEAQVAVEFYTEGDASWLEPGAHSLAAVVRNRGGQRQCIDAVPLQIDA